MTGRKFSGRIATITSGLVMTALLLIGLIMTAGPALAQTPPGAERKYGATWEVKNAPSEGRVGIKLVLPEIKVTNSGTLGWPGGGANELRLGYRWFYGYGALVPKTGATTWEDIRAPLGQDIPATGSIIFRDVSVGVPNEPGEYVLHLDLVQPNQNDTWLQTFGVADYAFKVSVKNRDVAAPTAEISPLPLYTLATSFEVSWSGKEEDGGSGIAGYDVEYKGLTDNDWTRWLSGVAVTSTTFTGDNSRVYQFRVRATDKSGNAGNFAPNGQAYTHIDTLAPVAGVDTLPALSPPSFLVRWSSFDNVDGRNVALYDVQYREADADPWADWLSGTSAPAALFKGEAGRSYSFRVRATDYAGNIGVYPETFQARTTVSAAQATSFVGTVSRPVTTTATGPKTLYFPYVVKNGELGVGTSGIVVQNSSSAPTDVFVRYNAATGAPVLELQPDNSVAPVSPDRAAALNRVATVLETVAAGGTKNFWAGNLDRLSYTGWAALVSSAPVTATAVRLDSNNRAIQYAPAEAANKLYLPYLRRGDNNNSSVVLLVNPNPVTSTVQVAFYNESGNNFLTQTYPMPRLSSLRVPLSSLNIQDRFTGSAIISATGATVAGSVELSLEDNSVVTYAAQTQLFSVAPQLPVYKEVDGYTTSLLVQNTSPNPVNVKAEFLDNNGTVIGVFEQKLGTFGRVISWQGNLPGNANFSGKVRVSSDAKTDVLAVTVIGGGPGVKGKSYL